MGLRASAIRRAVYSHVSLLTSWSLLFLLTAIQCKFEGVLPSYHCDAVDSHADKQDGQIRLQFCLLRNVHRGYQCGRIDPGFLHWRV